MKGPTTTPDEPRRTSETVGDCDIAMDRWKAVVESVGPRYEGCRVDNFRYSDDENERKRQWAVVNRLTAFGKDMQKNVDEGINLSLVGPKGTGKDHLLTGLMRRACGFRYWVQHFDGMSLFDELRGHFGGHNTGAKRLTGRLIDCDVLAISDPVPPVGELRDWQKEWLFRVVDQRYRHRKAVWITANFAKSKEAETAMGSQVWDRITDGGLVAVCNWPSYRKGERI